MAATDDADPRMRSRSGGSVWDYPAGIVLASVILWLKT
jgi:hypothetical protein